MLAQVTQIYIRGVSGGNQEIIEQDLVIFSWN